jgi:hypothetical protein
MSCEVGPRPTPSLSCEALKLEWTLPSLHLNVSSSLDDNDVSPFVAPSSHLLTSLTCLEAKIWTWTYHEGVESSYAGWSGSLVALNPLLTQSHVQLQCTYEHTKGRSQLFWTDSDLTMGDRQNFVKLGKKMVVLSFQSRGAKKSKIAFEDE